MTRLIAGVAVLVAVTVLVFVPGLLVGPSFDAAVFGTIGWLATEGRAPYAEAWDHKPPIIYGIQWLIHASPLKDGWWPTTVVASIAATATASVLIHQILRQMTVRSAVAGIAAVSCAAALGQYPLSLGGGLTETFAVVPLVAAFLLVTASRRRPALAGAGVLIALAIATSIQALPGAVAVAVLAVMTNNRLGVGAMFFGGLAALLAVVGALAALGVAYAAFDAVILYGAAYRSASYLDTAGLATATLVLLALIIPALLGAMRAHRLEHRARSAAITAQIWLLASLIGFVVQGRFETHYAITAVPALAVLAAVGLNQRTPVDRVVMPAMAAVGLLISVATAVTSSLPLAGSYAAENARIDRLASAVQARSPSDSTLIVWGLEPHLYLEAHRLPAGRYPYLYPLTTRGYGERLIEEELAAWRASMPALVVDAGSVSPGSPGAPPMLIDRDTDFDGRDLDVLDPLRGYIRQNYRLVGVPDGWPVYERIDADGGS